ncbi:MAG: MCP four helix bundle domain-containing protein, partial [Acidobacteria bacterium]|nr:MCP four helix bundle domain-containing protein [Acidobacteriota bacterium]
MSLTSPSVRATPTVRGALVAGFAVVFALWLVSGYELLRSVRDLERRVAAVHDTAFRGNQVLGTIRTSILLGSIYLRDALIDPSSRAYYRAELNRIRDEVERVLPTYQTPAASTPEREHWEKLRTELDYYWQSRQLVFAPDAPRTPDEAAALLRQRVVPARNSILDIVDSLSALQQA